MLFNSYPFLFVFLPLTLLGFFLLGRASKSLGSAWLALASLVFYGWWDTQYIPLLLASICINYWIGGAIARRAALPPGRRLLIVGVGANLSLLAYYKYANFFVSSAGALLSADWPALSIVLPIGISFFTFTQIAFLADAYAGKVKEYRFNYYVLFVTYFPHLIAGPVLHHKEMMPQFDADQNYRPQMSNFATGLTIFTIGLGKKVLIADSLAVYASPFFNQPDTPGLLVAWGGALAYTFQLYFDFSGYSDMAIGLSRLFGVQLPLNFNSPYKARNIAEFWRRWHMTLSRFLRDYLYIPLGGNRHGSLRRHINLMLTMVLGGLWHGAGWNFVIWGGLHGAYLVVHQAWSGFAGQTKTRRLPWLGLVMGQALTFVCAVFAWVYFRATDLATANQIILGMLGFNGTAIPDAVMAGLGPLRRILHQLGVTTFLGGGGIFFATWAWVIAAAVLAFCFPNTQEIVGYAESQLVSPKLGHAIKPAGLAWRPSRRHALVIGLALALGILSLSRPTEFLYFQF